MPNIGPLEIGIVLVIVLIVFGPKKLPDLGHSLGKGIREFKGSIGGDHDHDEDEKPRLSEPDVAVPESESAKVHGDPADAEIVRNKSS
jgi:sec-independent protein translocase protein TatA